MWPQVRGGLSRHRELALGVAFAGIAAWELVEVLALRLPAGAATPLSLALHAGQVLIVVAVTWTVIRAWQEKTRNQRALARMVDKVVLAQEEERRRIAYDVHDGIAQLIVSAKLHADTAADLCGHDPGRAAREIGMARDRLERAVVETRRVLMALRPSAVDALGLAEAARLSVAEAARESGWSVRFEEDLREGRLPSAVETAAFRILQEALANVARHAKSTCLDVVLGRRAGWLHLEVRDDGVGFRPDADLATGRGLGLSSMQERALLLGGTCRIESRMGAGTTVSLRLPIGDGSAEAAG